MAIDDQRTATRVEMKRKLGSTDLIHAGGFTGLAVGWLGLIPGLIPIVALTLLVALVLALPLIAISLATAIMVGPPYGVWRLATRARRRRRAQPEFNPTRPVAWHG